MIYVSPGPPARSRRLSPSLASSSSSLFRSQPHGFDLRINAGHADVCCVGVYLELEYGKRRKAF